MTARQIETRLYVNLNQTTESPWKKKNPYLVEKNRDFMSFNSTHMAIASLAAVTVTAIYAGADLNSLNLFYAAVGAYAGIREAIRIKTGK